MINSWFRILKKPKVIENVVSKLST